MRKSLIITVAIVLLSLCGCEAVVTVLENSEPQMASDMLLAAAAVTESSGKQYATTTSSVDINVPELNDEESGTPTDVEITAEKAIETVTKEEPRSSESVQPSIEIVEADKTSEQDEPPARMPNDPPTETDQPKPTEFPAPFSPPDLVPPEPPVSTEPLAPLETEPPMETQPKTAYDYEFDINAIRADCIVIGQSMGYTLNTSLNPQNATWWNPVTALSAC